MALPSPADVAAQLRALLPANLQHPAVAIVCGTGLAGLAHLVEDRVDIGYENIDGFEASTVVGHQSKLTFGKLRGVPVVAQAGRYHLYEVTNAAGGLNPSFGVPTICVLHDHIALPALSGLNPLIGPNNESEGTRFPAMSNAYDLELQRIAYRASHMLEFPDNLVQSGTYAWVTGPTYETRADCAFLRKYCGADVVGMSTVPEVIVARHAVSKQPCRQVPVVPGADVMLLHQSMRVLALSLVTNVVVGSPYRDIKAEVAAEFSNGEKTLVKAPESKEEAEEVANHEEVLEVGRQATSRMSALVSKIVELAASTV